jgi:hypothetical protein
MSLDKLVSEIEHLEEQGAVNRPGAIQGQYSSY